MSARSNATIGMLVSTNIIQIIHRDNKTGGIDIEGTAERMGYRDFHVGRKWAT